MQAAIPGPQGRIQGHEGLVGALAAGTAGMVRRGAQALVGEGVRRVGQGFPSLRPAQPELGGQARHPLEHVAGHLRPLAGQAGFRQGLHDLCQALRHRGRDRTFRPEQVERHAAGQHRARHAATRNALGIDEGRAQGPFQGAGAEVTCRLVLAFVASVPGTQVPGQATSGQVQDTPQPGIDHPGVDVLPGTTAAQFDRAPGEAGHLDAERVVEVAGGDADAVEAGIRCKHPRPAERRG